MSLIKFKSGYSDWVQYVVPLCTLSKSQRYAYDEIIADIDKKKSKKHYFITAGAGYGKTYLAKLIIKMIAKKLKTDDIIGLAPSHKAKHVLNESLENIECTTIHRFLGYVMEEKSQGSTYDSVGLIVSDIFKCRDRDLKNRLMYVALSRAKKFIVV